MLRCSARVQVRTPVQTSVGTFDDGRPWTSRKVEVIDSDQNKVELRVLEGLDLSPGLYDIELDVQEQKGQAKAKTTIVAFRPVAAPAARAAS